MTPTLFFILVCVTLNRPQRDTEIVCGAYRIQWSADGMVAEYTGLGDDPSRYRLSDESGRLRIKDDQPGNWRPARDHRKLVLEQWIRRLGAEQADGAVANEGEDGAHDRLRRCLTTLSRHDPVPAAILAYGQGLADIHNLFRVQQLVRGAAGPQAARAILGEVHAGVDGMSPQRAAEALRLLAG